MDDVGPRGEDTKQLTCERKQPHLPEPAGHPACHSKAVAGRMDRDPARALRQIADSAADAATGRIDHKNLAPTANQQVTRRGEGKRRHRRQRRIGRRGRWMDRRRDLVDKQGVGRDPIEGKTGVDPTRDRVDFQVGEGLAVEWHPQIGVSGGDADERLTRGPVPRQETFGSRRTGLDEGGERVGPPSPFGLALSMAGDTAPLEDRGDVMNEAHRSHRLDRSRRFDSHPVGMGFAASIVGILDHEKDRACP